ncbi:MAG TPA: isocitrate/isopropylmalate family dehydrogenase [Dehalococcoidia bacterium]|nr:isocitrate/isopropylmalate family dehydrogenase [Dehalococcoidia bacterium]
MQQKRRYRVVVIEGDGIGPEVIAAALPALHAAAHAAGFVLELEPQPAGAGLYQWTGTAMSRETFELCRTADAVLKGPVGLPGVRTPDGTEAGLLGGVLRRGLDLYANLRPIRLLDGVASPLAGRKPGEIDYAIVRENTEGLYIARGLGVATPDAVADTMLITRRGTERVARFALDLAHSGHGAPRDRVKRLTCVDKANVLRGYAFFRAVVAEVAAEYPDVEVEYRYVDAMAQALVLEPDRFDVVLCENFIGDILSDLGGATVGGLGFCPSGNIGEHGAYFEPIHGSAPDIAGRDLANPVATLLSGAMLLDHLGEFDAAASVRAAVSEALRRGVITSRPDGTLASGCRAAGEAIAALVTAPERYTGS